MKKTLLSLVAGLFIVSGSIAQNITIYESGQTTNLSGQMFSYELNEVAVNHHVVDFLINNNSASGQPWIVTRRIMSQPVSWANSLCWGISGQIGNCYPSSASEYFDSQSITIPAGGAGLLSTYVDSPGSGVASYRYYVSTDGINFLDSVDLQVTSVLAVEEIAPSLSVSVAPNPASESVKVTAQGVDEASVRIIDILGNVILTTTIQESKTIDVSEFRNGIYFISVESKGVKAVNRKVIVRH